MCITLDNDVRNAISSDVTHVPFDEKRGLVKHGVEFIEFDREGGPIALWMV